MTVLDMRVAEETGAGRDHQVPQSDRAPKLGLGRLENIVGYLLRRAYRHSRRHALPVLQAHGFKELEITALIIVIENPGCSLTDLAHAVDVELPVAQRHLKNLEAAGRVVSSKSATDRRVTTYRPTQKGLADYAAMIEEAHKVDDEFYEDLDVEDLRGFVRSLKALSGIG